MTTQLPIKERLEKIASMIDLAGPDHILGFAAGEVSAMARALLAAHEQEPVMEVRSHYNGEYVCRKLTKGTLKPGVKLYANHAPVPAVPDEIVGWVMEVNGDSRDPLFLCGSISPYEGKAYNSQYFPVKRAAMLNGGKS